MEKPRLQDNFYEAVNYDWLQTAEIPADKPSTGAFHQLHDDLEKLQMEEARGWADGSLPLPEDPRMHQFVELYKMAIDTDQRDQLGYAPLLPFLAYIDELTSWSDLQQKSRDFILNGYDLPFSFSISTDMKDTSRHVLYIGLSGTILPDRTYYEEGKEEEAEALLAVYSQMSLDYLLKTGHTEERAKDIVEAALRFDKSFALLTKSSEESADYVASYNPIPFTDLSEKCDVLDLPALLRGVLPSEPDVAIVTNPRGMDGLKTFVNEESFDDYKAWLYLNTALSFAGLLTDELRILAGTYGRALTGAKEPAPFEKSAYRFAHGYFSAICGLNYAKDHFSKRSRDDIEDMVRRMIAVYRSRMDAHDWLSAETRAKAKVKLDNLGYHVGYPDRVRPYYDEFIVQNYAEGGDLVSNSAHFSRLITEYVLAKLDKPVERDLWGMSADTVNAYYSPQLNCIVFPAAILQPPFYSPDQTRSANYGGIGAVMAHEISHAFDNNGAKFDEFGNLSNWWTEDDLKSFEDKAKAMEELFDGLPCQGGTVNGKLTVSENIADSGGLSCALEAAKADPDCDLRALFENWARVWRNKSRDAYAKMLATVDVHSPAAIRGNEAVRNFAEFHEAFGIKPGDKMYRAPEDFVAIW